MKKLRYSEKFYSLQGEGYHVGVPSVFLRTFGCNFRCKNFGRDRDEEMGKYNPEVIPIIDALDQYEKFEDLPIVKTGCDTYASIYPEFKRFMQDETVEEVAEGLLAQTPNNSWYNGNDYIHLILTGGEPMLGWQKLYPELLDLLIEQGLRHLTIETNTTQPLHDDFARWIIRTPQDKLHITFSCSPKLGASGHTLDESIKPDVALDYWNHCDIIYFKFVVAEETDLDEIENAMAQYQAAGLQDIPVYLMPVGGTVEEYENNMTKVAQYALNGGYRFSPRLHASLFGNEWGT